MVRLLPSDFMDEKTQLERDRGELESGYTPRPCHLCLSSSPSMGRPHPHAGKASQMSLGDKGPGAVAVDHTTLSMSCSAMQEGGGMARSLHFPREYRN